MATSFVYMALGSRQPRTSKFVPVASNSRQEAKTGLARVKNIDRLPDRGMNDSVLSEYGVPEPTSTNVPVKAGDVVIAARPFVRVQATSCRGELCEYCFSSSSNLVACDSCNYALYCSYKCADSDFVDHKNSGECELIRRRKRPPSSDTVRFVLRLLLKLRTTASCCQEMIPDGDTVPGQPSIRLFSDLLDHYDDIVLRSPTRLEMVNACYNEIVDIMGEHDAPDPDYFIEVYGRMVINSFNIIDADEQVAIASAVFLGPSVLDHSCIPNASVTFDLNNQGAIIVRALEDLPTRDFSSLFISYLDLMDHTTRRRDHLFRHYYFLCQCYWCSNEASLEKYMFSVCCSHCGSLVHMESNWRHILDCQDMPKCTVCKEKMNRLQINNYVDICEVVEEKVNKTTMSSDVAELCLRIMDREHFSTLHIYYIKCTEVVFDQLYCDLKNKSSDDTRGILKEAFCHGQILLAAFERYERPVWPTKGLILKRLGHIEQKMGLQAQSKTHTSESKRILTVSRGRY